MRKIIVFACAFVFTYPLFAQSVAINGDGSLPNSAAMLDIKSTTKGLLIPRMTTAQRTVLPNVQGLMVFDTDAGIFFYNNGTGWVDISAGTNYWVSNSNNIYNLNTSFVGIGVSDPVFKLDVGNRMRLRSQGTAGITAGIWFNNYSNTDITGFIGEVGDGAPNHLGIFGATSGWQFVMNTVSGNVGINTFNTGAGNGKLNVRNNIDGNAIKLIGNNQYLSFYDEADNPKCYVWNSGNNMIVSTNASNTNGELQLLTKSASGMVVQSDGRIRMGAQSQFSVYDPNIGAQLPKLTVQGPIGIKKNFGNQVDEWELFYNSTDDIQFDFFGVNVSFISNIDGSWNTFSDRSLKEYFKAYGSVLSNIQKLPVLTYHYKSNKAGVRSFGLIAQDVQKYFPEIVTTTANGLLAMDYSKVGVLAVKAIQEQQVIIEALQKKNDELEKRLERLENERSRK